MATTPQQRIQIKRRDSAPASAEGWAYLLDGELGYIKDENGLYIGLGSGNSAVKVNVTSWDQLEDKPSNIISQIYLNSTDPTKIVYKKVGSNTEHTLGNFAPLTNGLIDLKYLPQGALERLVVVANATARLKLTTANVQLGDTVKETDTGLMYVVVDESKLNSEDGYQVYVAGRAAAVDWTGVENKVNATSSSAGLMSAADKKKLDNTNVAYGTCTTAANVAAKVITVSGNTGWKLAAGSMISIFFSYTNTAQNPTFNVNGTGAKNVYYNQSQITTSSLSYAGYTNRICNYIYDGTQFRFHSWGYDANTNTQVRVYRNSTSSYNKDYPLIASRTLAADLGTVGTQDSNEAVYGLISDTAANIPTINPYSGAVKVKTLSATGNISTSDGNVSGKLLHTTAAANLNAVSDKVAVIKSGGQISYRTPAQIISDAGVTATVAEINYVDGVTSNIQTQLNSKAIATDAIYFNQTGTIGSNGTFTNLIPSSTDSSGNIYNGVGYKEGIRWSKSGKAEVAAAGHHMSGFIPCKTGDTLNIKNITIGNNDPYIVLFDSSKNVINTIAASSVAPDSQAVRSYLITISGVAFIRISAQTINAASVATVNEYISSGYLTGWLKQFNGAEIAPSTYISQVLDANGNPYDQHTHSYLPLKGGTLTGDLTLQQNNQDRFITFEYTGNTGFDWRIGSLGTGSADENYFVIQSDKDSSNNGAFVNALRIGLTSLNALFGGNVTATKFIGPLQGNADTATKLKTARTISLTGDATGSVSFDGSANASITVTVADDSHNHTISNIDNLQSNLDLKYDKEGGPISGHIYMTGSSASSSTANTTQLIFGTSSTQHVAVTSNDKALVINPNSSATTNQIVLYLNQQSVFPGGIKISAGNLDVSGTSTLTGAVTAKSTLTVNGASTLKGAVTMNSTLQVDGKSTLKGDVEAKKTIKIGDGVTLQYNSTNKSLEFVFN